MDIKFVIKENSFVRFLLKPYMDLKRKKEFKDYQNSKDSQYIKTFKNKYAGKRCFIIGNGPSLRFEDLNLLVNEYTFGANRIYKFFDRTIWRPSFYMATDRDVIRESWQDLNAYNFNEIFLDVDPDFDLSQINGNVTRIYQDAKFRINKYNDLTAYISEDVSKCFSVGYTVTFCAIQFAIYMGFKEIYLLGMDFNFSTRRGKNGSIQKDNSIKDHFYEKKYNAITPFYYDNNLYAYNVAKQYADVHGIKIFNATRGGKLEVFERVDFDSIIKK